MTPADGGVEMRVSAWMHQLIHDLARDAASPTAEGLTRLEKARTLAGVVPSWVDRDGLALLFSYAVAMLAEERAG